jgi:CubicO group peptidase (beta-lactamase class C family)
MADRLAALPLVYEPGTKWSYSIGLDLMGRLIEVVSGQPFDAFLKARLFDPLGMTSTGFMVSAKDVGRFTSNYAPFGGALIPFDPARARSISTRRPIRSAAAAWCRARAITTASSRCCWAKARPAGCG